MPSASYCPHCLHSFEAQVDRCPNMGCKAWAPRSGWPKLLSEGDLIDRTYRVDRLLAVGGAGLTYQARQTDDAGVPKGPDLAVKVLYDRRSAGSFLRRLANEAQILQELNHDHIVQCVGFVQRQGQAPYLVTRYLQGGNLEEHVQRTGPLPPWTAAGILRQVLEALQVAHKRGVVHRDLKPANVLLAKQTDRAEIPHIRVADFGIAKVADGFGEKLTRVGVFIGTPEYAAPEQFAGEPATPAADIYATGALLFFLLTGRPHFVLPPSATVAELHELILAQTPPDLPGAILASSKGALLQAVIRGTMVGPKDQRWGIGETIGWLDHVLGLRPTPPQRRRRAAGETDEAQPGRRVRRPPPSGRLGSETVSFLVDATDERTRQGRTEHTAEIPDPGADEPTQRMAPVPTPQPEPLRDSPTIRQTRGAEDTQPAQPARPTAPLRRTGIGADRPLPKPRSPRARPAAPVRSSAPPAPRDGRTQPQGLTLDDIFGEGAGGQDSPTQAQPRLDSHHRTGRDPLLGDYDRPVAGRVRVGPSGQPWWWPARAQEMPDRVPQDATEFLCVLAVVHPDDRPPITTRLLGLHPGQVNQAVRAYSTGGDPAHGRGICLAAQLLSRREWTPQVRTLLADPDPGVRVAAATALSVLGDSSSLRTLEVVCADAQAQVRVVAARALAHIAERIQRPEAALPTLRRMAYDPDDSVKAAVQEAMLDLGA